MHKNYSDSNPRTNAPVKLMFRKQCFIVIKKTFFFLDPLIILYLYAPCRPDG